MDYNLRLTASAEADIVRVFERIREVAPDSAAKWLTGLFAAIMTLAAMPTRCPMIPEADELGHLARHLLYGPYRVVFDVQEQSEEGPRVRVLRIWHSARDDVSAEDLDVEY